MVRKKMKERKKGKEEKIERERDKNKKGKGGLNHPLSLIFFRFFYSWTWTRVMQCMVDKGREASNLTQKHTDRHHVSKKRKGKNRNRAYALFVRVLGCSKVYCIETSSSNTCKTMTRKHQREKTEDHDGEDWGGRGCSSKNTVTNAMRS